MSEAHEAVLGAETIARGFARRRGQLRHYRLDTNAYLVSVLRFGGERFRPVAFRVSSLADPTEDDLIVVPNYHDTPSVLAATAVFARKIRKIVESGHQIVVPNKATIKALGLAGRALAFRNQNRRYGLLRAESTDLAVAGRYLLELSRRSRKTGSFAILALAEEVAKDYVTLTAPFERSDIKTLWAQINPHSDIDFFDLVSEAKAEQWSAGPNMHPIFEEKTIYPIHYRVLAEAKEKDYDVVDYVDAEEGALKEIRDAYATQTDRCHETMRKIIAHELPVPSSPAAVMSLKSDQVFMARVVERLADLEFFSARDTPIGAALSLFDLESAKAEYDFLRRLSDPIHATTTVENGQGIIGEVLLSNSRGVTVRVLRGNLDRLNTEGTFFFTPAETRHGFAVSNVVDDEIDFLQNSARINLPPVGSQVLFLEKTFSDFVRRAPALLPWTHGGSLEQPGTEDVMEGDTSIEVLPSPEMGDSLEITEDSIAEYGQ